MATKHSLPDPAHVAVAEAVMSAVDAVPDASVEALPTKVKDAFDFLAKTRDAAAQIAHSQPVLLAEYRADLASVVGDENADSLLSSFALARLLADVANGRVEPVASTPKPRASSARKTTAKKPMPDPVDVYPSDPEDDFA